MKLYSKIRIIFLMAFLLLTALFISYFYIQKTQHHHKNEKRYMQTSMFFLKHFRHLKDQDFPNNQFDENNENIKFFLKESNFKYISPSKIKFIEAKAHKIFERPLFRSKVRVLRYQKNIYLLIKTHHFNLLFQDQEDISFPNQVLFFYLLFLIFLISLYVWIIQSLKPLKSLHSQIQDVTKGDFSISFKSKQKDEIADVSNAFDEALRKIEGLINSRQLFLRTIMHELKTPIAKGRLLNEFLINHKQQEGFDAIFERLELLIEEFSKIEQMLSSSYKLNIKSYHIQEMIDQALELMIMDEEEQIDKVKIIKKEGFILETDFELFSLALKNLIDNALKYSPNHKVEILIQKNSIYIANTGEQFTKDLAEYTQPFNPKGKGLGLGLYIVQNILTLLKLNLSYEYKDGKNIFLIDYIKA